MYIKGLAQGIVDVSLGFSRAYVFCIFGEITFLSYLRFYEYKFACKFFFLFSLCLGT